MTKYFDNLSINLPEKTELLVFYGKTHPEILKEVESLRVNVWKSSGFEISPESQNDTHWGDEWDDVSTHFVLAKDQKPIAARRASLHDSISETPYPDWFEGVDFTDLSPIMYISRLIVHPDFQKQGLSDYFDKKCIEFGKSHNAGVIVGDVPEYRIKPLLRRGFEVTSEPKLGVLFPTMRFTGVMLKIRG
jgi:hypothetical protein